MTDALATTVGVRAAIEPDPNAVATTVTLRAAIEPDPNAVVTGAVLRVALSMEPPGERVTALALRVAVLLSLVFEGQLYPRPDGRSRSPAGEPPITEGQLFPRPDGVATQGSVS